MPTKNLPGFIAALGAVFRKADPQMLEDLADTFDPSSDFRQAQTTVPDRDSLKTGPAEPMSGQGARRMTKDYSFGATEATTFSKRASPRSGSQKGSSLSTP